MLPSQIWSSCLVQRSWWYRQSVVEATVDCLSSRCLWPLCTIYIRLATVNSKWYTGTASSMTITWRHAQNESNCMSGLAMVQRLLTMHSRLADKHCIPIYWGSQLKRDALLRLKWCVYLRWSDDWDERSRCRQVTCCFTVGSLSCPVSCPVSAAMSSGSSISSAENDCWRSLKVSALFDRLIDHFLLAFHVNNVCYCCFGWD